MPAWILVLHKPNDLAVIVEDRFMASAKSFKRCCCGRIIFCQFGQVVELCISAIGVVFISINRFGAP